MSMSLEHAMAAKMHVQEYLAGQVAVRDVDMIHEGDHYIIRINLAYPVPDMPTRINDVAVITRVLGNQGG